MRSGIGLGFLIGRSKLINFEFDPNHPYVGCRLCGVVFQSNLDRQNLPGAQEERERWRVNHNKKHSEKEHIALIKSGLWCTPEAAQKLAPLGIINFTDMLFDHEVAHAMATAPRAPINDVEGSG